MWTAENLLFTTDWFSFFNPQSTQSRRNGRERKDTNVDVCAKAGVRKKPFLETGQLWMVRVLLGGCSAGGFTVANSQRAILFTWLWDDEILHVKRLDPFNRISALFFSNYVLSPWIISQCFPLSSLSVRLCVQPTPAADLLITHPSLHTWEVSADHCARYKDGVASPLVTIPFSLLVRCPPPGLSVRPSRHVSSHEWVSPELLVPPSLPANPRPH